jgi:hypothetical protein
MKAAEKEVEQLEKKYREENGLPVEPEEEGQEGSFIDLPKFHDLQRLRCKKKRAEAERERRQLEDNVKEIEEQIRATQERLREFTGSFEPTAESAKERKIEAEERNLKQADIAPSRDGAIGPGGDVIAFPPYDGSEPPNDWKKPFTQFCIRTRKDVKNSLQPGDRKNKVSDVLVNSYSALLC